MQQEGQASLIPLGPIKEAFHRHTHGGGNLLGSGAIYGQRLGLLLKRKFLLSKKNKKIKIKIKKGQKTRGRCVRKGKKREVEKRDSPQAQDHQAKWGG